jgi:hypothetical protein
MRHNRDQAVTAMRAEQLVNIVNARRILDANHQRRAVLLARIGDPAKNLAQVILG